MGWEEPLSTFELIAAIDIRAGRVVRLVQGDFGRETVYGDDPSETARALASTGVAWLHLVDLDGASSGAPQQSQLIGRVVAAAGSGTACQVAGGLRTEGAVETAFENGARRVVLGTAALAEPGFAGALVRRFGTERIACAIDVRDGRALGHGWRTTADAPSAEDAISRLAEVGVTRLVVTAIDRDGLLEGLDLVLLRAAIGLDVGDVLASGGLSSIADLLAVRDLGCAGAIVGRAIYEGRLDLAEAVRVLALDT